VLKARGPFVNFKPHGESGIEVSDLFPHIATQADRLCVIRSMQTEHINHDTAHAFMNTGSIIKGRPSMGSWLLYGLGSATQELPGFIVLTSAGKYGLQPISARQWSSGVMPSRFQGIMFQSQGEAVHSIGNPAGVCQSTQRQVVEEIGRLNGYLAEQQNDPEIATRIAQYEMAFRMQASVPELTDVSGETQETPDLYGVKQPGDGSFASNCLLARRGLLDDTLVLWGGEFGRTPMGQGTGRDHRILSFSVFLAGGGIRPGTTWGETDELGYRAVDKIVDVHDLHATMLALMGIDHHRLTTKFQGLDVRLTGVAGKVVKGIMA